MIQTQLFHEIARHRRLVEKNKNLFQLFCAAFEVSDSANQISNLQKEFIITELAFTYSHLGYSLFADSSIHLAKYGLSWHCGVDASFVEKYMRHLKQYLYDEIQFEKKENYFSQQNLELSFAREFVKRIFCTEIGEDIQTGINIFDKKYVERIRALSRKKITEFSTEGNLHWDALQIQEEKDQFYFDNIYHEFILFLQNLKQDSLILIVSRFESFINFFKNDFNSLFIFKEQSEFIDEKSKKMTALLALLVPHQHNNGEMLFQDNLLTVRQMGKLFSPKFKSKLFNLKSIQNWLSIENNLNLIPSIEFLMEEAIQCGVVFKVPKGNKDFSYGLSESGMKIIQPFQRILTDSLLLPSEV